MAENKYKIILDSNIVYHDDEDNLDKPFNLDILKIKKFIKQYKKLEDVLEICIPRVVIRERIKERLDTINRIIDRIGKNFLKLEVFGIKESSQYYKENDYKKELEKRITEFIEKEKFIVIEIPAIAPDVLIERAIEKKPPFTKEGDKGIKDTLIWLSILEYVKNNPDTNFILLSNDNDFVDEQIEEEFKINSKKKFTIIHGRNDLEGYLDVEFGLNLELESQYTTVKSEIRKEIGNITSQIMEKLHAQKYYYREYNGQRVFNYFRSVGYTINNIEVLKENEYSINLKLQTKGGVGELIKDYFATVWHDSGMFGSGTTTTSSSSSSSISWVSGLTDSTTVSTIGGLGSTWSYSQEITREANFEANLKYEKGNGFTLISLKANYPVEEERVVL